MQYVDIRGARVPALGLGTWQVEGQQCRAMVEAALELGYRRVDTAQLYGNEANVGGALRASGVPRSDLWVTTKLAPANLGYEQVLRSGRDSLQRLGLEYLDLLLIHWPSQEVPLEETFRAMEALQDDGVTRYLGVSNFPPGLLERARHMAPVISVQVEYHPYLCQDRLVLYAQEFELMLTAYTPLAHGRAAKDPTLASIGKRHGKTASQVALRWLVQQPHVSAIPRAQSVEHLRENLDIFDFELSPQEMRQIFQLERGMRLINPSFAPNWNQLH